MISIIIPVWNQPEMTAECIAALMENTTDYELIVVDNGSDDPFRLPAGGWYEVTTFGSAAADFIPVKEGIGPATVIRNEENLGFPAAVNQGIRVAKGDVIVLLNNDVIVTPGWSGKLLAHMDRFSIVGPLTNYCAGKQRTVIPLYEDAETLYRNAIEWSAKHEGQSINVNWIIGFLFMFRRSVVDDIGLFDESMWPSSGEEIDFCLRARAAGHKVGIARDVYVHHDGSQTFKAMEDAGILDYGKACEDSENHLKKKWGEGFWQRQIVKGEDDGLRINLGCGRFPLTGFINIDQDPEVKPDLVCDILALPYELGTVDEIYAGHVLEHFDWEDGEKALRYWRRLLKPGGRISVTVPDCDVLFGRYAGKPSAEALRELNDLYIYSYRQKSPHKYAYSADLLAEVMEAAGFENLKRLPIDHPYFPYPVDWQAGIEGVKP